MVHGMMPSVSQDLLLVSVRVRVRVKGGWYVTQAKSRWREVLELLASS